MNRKSIFIATLIAVFSTLGALGVFGSGDMPHQQTLYRGFCVYNDQLPQAVALFNEKKTDILALFRNNTHLSKNMRDGAIDYIEDFYKIINDPKKLDKYIIDKCRGKK